MTLQQKIKLVLFCFYNHLEDYLNSILIGLDNKDRILAHQDNLWPEVKYIYALSVKKLMYIPGDSFEKAKMIINSYLTKSFLKCISFMRVIGLIQHKLECHT